MTGLKKILAGLIALGICGALNFGLTNEAQVAKLDSSNIGTQLQNLDGAPPPPPNRNIEIVTGSSPTTHIW